MGKFIDLSGTAFGRLTVLHRAEHNTPQGHPMWVCKCSCGNMSTVYRGSLQRGDTRSCGCLEQESRQTNNLKHGLVGTYFYRTWQGMHGRCGNPNNPKYRHYGARGIKVCGRWSDVDNFAADMGPRPSAMHSIDRINNDGDYEPNNCRWATLSEQRINQRPCKKPRKSMTIHCSKGHPLDASNVKIKVSRGREYRQCITCERARLQNRDRRKVQA